MGIDNVHSATHNAEAFDVCGFEVLPYQLLMAQTLPFPGSTGYVESQANLISGGTMTANRALVTIAAVVLTPNLQAAAAENTTFALLRSTSAVNANCIPNAKGRVTINSLGSVEVMHVEIGGLPANKEFDVFVIQLPNAPFGLSWYQGDIETNGSGTGVGDFVGRFSKETFIVAPGTGPAPVIHNQAPFPDASSNPATGPVHTFHLGVWFGSASDAQAAGCPNTVTPFNGDHNAGIQALSTRGFGNLNGPLNKIQ